MLASTLATVQAEASSLAEELGLARRERSNAIAQAAAATSRSALLEKAWATSLQVRAWVQARRGRRWVCSMPGVQGAGDSACVSRV